MLIQIVVTAHGTISAFSHEEIPKFNDDSQYEHLNEKMTRFTIFAAGIMAIWFTTGLTGQDDSCGEPGALVGVDLMDTRNFTLLDYRRMFMNGATPCAHELQGHWRGVNKGIATWIGYRQFIKEIQPCGEVYFGDNIQVHQVSNQCLRCMGWQPKVECDGSLERKGKFAVQPADCRGPFGHGIIFSYRDGGNPKRDPSRLLVDKVVKIDDNHLLGRAVAKVGLMRIPLAYFMLERVE